MRLGRVLLLVCLTLAILPAAAQAEPVAFSDSYSAFNSLAGCTAPRAVPGYTPADGARHPVFLYVHAYSGDYSTEWKTIAQEAARLGFVAAAPRYTSELTLSRYGVEGHAKCMFGPGANSALTKVCARPDADCSKGVVVSGLSLGSTIAIRAANASSLVRAAYIIGSFSSLESYVKAPPAGDRALPNSGLRMTLGREDAKTNDVVNAVTGRSCSTPSCFAADGSGYYIVQDAEVADGRADHCFHFLRGGCYGTQDPFDPGWRPGSRLAWALDPALEWLRSRTG